MTWIKKKEKQDASDKRQYFWVTCHKCKAKLAIPPDWVFKYMERIVGYEHEDKKDS